MIHLWDFEVRKSCDEAVTALIAALSRRIAEVGGSPDWWPLPSPHSGSLTP